MCWILHYLVVWLPPIPNLKRDAGISAVLKWGAKIYSVIQCTNINEKTSLKYTGYNRCLAAYDHSIHMAAPAYTERECYVISYFQFSRCSFLPNHPMLPHHSALEAFISCHKNAPHQKQRNGTSISMLEAIMESKTYLWITCNNKCQNKSAGIWDF